MDPAESVLVEITVLTVTVLPASYSHQTCCSNACTWAKNKECYDRETNSSLRHLIAPMNLTGRRVHRAYQEHHRGKDTGSEAIPAVTMVRCARQALRSR